MRKTNTLFFIFLMITCSIYAQSPVLVQDFNTGPEDSFREWDERGVILNESFILPISTLDQGVELGLLKDGVVSLLVDLYPGEESSTPKNFTFYKGKLYFTAENEEGHAIWTTDGTAAGTSFVARPEAAFTTRPIHRLFVTDGNTMYYSRDGNIYSFDGSNHVRVFEGANLIGSISQNIFTYCKYGDGLAIVVTDNDKASMYLIEESGSTLLADNVAAETFTDIVGVVRVSEGILFGLSDSFNEEISGTYLYDEQLGMMTRLAYDGEGARRIHAFTNDQALIWKGGEGYFTVNGDISEDVQIFDTDNTSITSGSGIPYAEHEGKMIAYVTEDFFGDEFLVYTDGTAAGTQAPFLVDPYPVKFYNYGSYAFFASGTSNGFEPTIYKIDLTDGKIETVITFEERSLNGPSILFLGILDGKLHCASYI